jgi:hypothetical protein
LIHLKYLSSTAEPVSIQKVMNPAKILMDRHTILLGYPGGISRHWPKRKGTKVVERHVPVEILGHSMQNKRVSVEILGRPASIGYKQLLEARHLR